MKEVKDDVQESKGSGGGIGGGSYADGKWRGNSGGPGGTAGAYPGGGCDERCRSGKRACLMHKNSEGRVIAKGSNSSFPDFDITDGDFSKLKTFMDDRQQGADTIPLHVCLTRHYRVCASSFITELSWELLRQYNRIWKKCIFDPVGWQEYPAIMLEATEIIENELAEVREVKTAEQNEKQEAVMQAARNKR